MAAVKYKHGAAADKALRALLEAKKENDLWHAIRVKSNSDPTLKSMLDDIKVYYILKYVK